MPTAVDYDALEVIGQGSFGSIRKVRRKNDGVIMARKEIKYEKMEQKERDQLTSEFSILSALRHPNIVQYHHREHVKEHQMVYIYMEYCGGGDLSKLLKDVRKNCKPLREEIIWEVFVQLVYALYRCHYGVDPPECPPNTRNQAPPAHNRGNTVIHRDLKPENVFLDESNTVKLGDFGLSKMLGSEHQMAMTYVGTPLYMSPELVSDTPYTIKTDIWSLGCIMYEMCTLKPPFTAKTPHQLFNTIKQGKFDPISSYYSAELRGVIEQCLRCDPKERPETAQLLFMPAMQNPRKVRELALQRKYLQAKDSMLSKREAQVAAKERDMGNMSARLMAKGHELMAKEQELRNKEHELRNKEEDMKRFLEESTHRMEQLGIDIRNEWRVKAEIEVRQQVDRLKIDLESQFEFAVNQRAEAQLHHSVEAQLLLRVEMELQRKITELNLVPADSLSVHSAHSSSTSSQLSAETGITSVSSSFHSPARHSPAQLLAPGSPVDVDMHSPYRDQSPLKQDNIFDKPSAMSLRQGLHQKSLFEYRLSDPGPLGNTSMQDLGEELEDDEGGPEPQGTTLQQHSRVAPTGSPIKRAGNGQIRRTQTAPASNLFSSSSRTAPAEVELDTASIATAKSLNQKENQPWEERLIPLREVKLKVTQQKGPVATWDRNGEDIPSPFKKPR